MRPKRPGRLRRRRSRSDRWPAGWPSGCWCRWGPSSSTFQTQYGGALATRRCSACAPARRRARRAYARHRRESGALPRRSGSPKLTRPSPPNVVPSSENNAWFWLMGRSCPSHSAQLLRRKLEGHQPYLGQERFSHASRLPPKKTIVVIDARWRHVAPPSSTSGEETPSTSRQRLQHHGVAHTAFV